MKAIRVPRFGDAGVLELVEIPAPVLGAGQVVVRLNAIGINPVETYIRSGIYGPKVFPYTPGTDGAGVVESVGEGVKEFAAGVGFILSGSVSGTYAELAAAKVEDVHALPANVDFDGGAALGVPYATAYRALVQRGEVRAGETVLIHGASGGVGTAATQFAAAMGCTVIGTAGSEEGMKLVRAQGAAHVLNHHEEKYLEAVKTITDGRGVDLIVEFAAQVNLGKDLSVLAKNGRVVVVGSRGPVEVNPRDTMRIEAEIRGVTLHAATKEELREIHAAIGAGLRNQTLRPVIGRKFPLAEAGKAHEEVMGGKHAGKILLLA